MRRYAAPWDRRLKVGTAFFLLTTAALAAAFLVARSGLPASAGAQRALLGAAPLVIGALVAASWALGPRGYAVERGLFVVERPLGRIEVPLREVRSAGLLPDGVLRGSTRLAGVSCAFGHCGWYWSGPLGRFRMYATRSTRLVCLQTARATFVISPEPAERFVDDVLAHAPAASPSALPAGAPAPVRFRPWRLAALLGGVLVLALGGTMLGTWAYAPRAAWVRGGAVVVERRWTGPRRIPLASVREARPLQREEYRGWRRVSGVAGPGAIAYGRYQSDRLGEFQLYAWRRGPCVLLETSSGKVVLTPEDPPAFLGELRRARAP